MSMDYTQKVDNLNRLCDHSTLGSDCNTPNVNAAVSGSLAVSGTLNTVASGTLNVVNSGSLAVSGSLTSTLSGGIFLRGGNATVGNTTILMDDATLKKWIPLALVGLEVIGAAIWSNPLLMVAGILGFFSVYAHSVWTEATWLLFSILAIVLPALPRIAPGFLARMRGDKR